MIALPTPDPLHGKSPEEILRLIDDKDKLLGDKDRHIVSLNRKVSRLESLILELRQSTFFSQEQLLLIRNKLFGKSSEKSPSEEAREQAQDQTTTEAATTPVAPKAKRTLLPSERYLDAPLIEREVEYSELPSCPCCKSKMQDSGLTEDSEFLTVIPTQYLVIRQKRHKYRCGKCQSALVTAPGPLRIKPGSAYSDEMTIDVAIRKYCDLIPIQRYAAMAERAGIKDLPHQSLIQATHYLAQFVKPAYESLRNEVLTETVLHADETPHRMLEGDDKQAWYLWGFSSLKSAYFDIRDTRSGDVASELLKDSKCEYLITDKYSGYQKAVRETNEHRERSGNDSRVANVYCNAHARRKFKEALESGFTDAQYFIDQYREIYRLEKEVREPIPPDKSRTLELRRPMIEKFDQMRAKAQGLLEQYSSKSGMLTAVRYFLESFRELTVFTTNAELPIDNNQQERLLRNPVIGRKTWYGTHSKQGAETAAILFSLIESCKLNRVNPREYLAKLVEAIHTKQPVFTPKDFRSH